MESNAFRQCGTSYFRTRCHALELVLHDDIKYHGRKPEILLLFSYRFDVCITVEKLLSQKRYLQYYRQYYKLMPLAFEKHT